MDFHHALKAAFNQGQKVTRRSWNNRNIYLSMVEMKLCITGYSDPKPDDGKPHPLVVHESDYYADDWEIIDD